ncbi:MAG TPA: bifunctional precorrin-2 dehydrogenase/sirohydrochlorin ferrochelatase [Candidatus Binatia bacterium]|nr:bifunctional precorrin-2 dehydrogenase/sirohydrochlorin ferrochelatase [Candidatus Binatia bacterium]
MSYLPILLKLRDHPCVVVGGGMAATKKVEALLSADARLTVISPQVTEIIARLAAAGHLQLVSRSYTRGDLRGFFLAYAATGVSAVDEQIARDAASEHILMSVADGRSLGNFMSPPIVQRGDLTIAISTNGRSRGFAQLMKKKLARLIGPEYGDLLDIVEAERLVMKSPRPAEKSGKSLPNEAAS